MWVRSSKNNIKVKIKNKFNSVQTNRGYMKISRNIFWLSFLSFNWGKQFLFVLFQTKLTTTNTNLSHLASHKLVTQNLSGQLFCNYLPYLSHFDGNKQKTRLSCFNVKTNCFIFQNLISLVRLISSLGQLNSIRSGKLGRLIK